MALARNLLRGAGGRLAMAAICSALALPNDRVVGQTVGHSIAVQAEADVFSTELGGFLLAIPGVDDDFVLFADGAIVERAGGTLRFSAHVHRRAAFDREFFLVLEFAGRSAPGDVGYPPVGSPVLTLQAGAYVPLGPVDPSTLVYFTQVTGTLTGLRNYAGARLSAVNVGAAQMGLGANNKNVGQGLAVDLALTVLQQPGYGVLVPTGAATLRVSVQPSLVACMTHVDANAAVSSGPLRAAVVIPGVASDHVFLPVGTWLEASDGTATLAGVIRRQSDHSDAWACSLQLSGRLDPGAAAYPPPGSPVLQLLPSAYGAQGGPVEPAQWRYYTQGVGSLIGSGRNAGGVIQVALAGAMQVGLGANQGNLFYGLAGALVVTAIVQPSGNPLNVTGNLSVCANLATECMLRQSGFRSESLSTAVLAGELAEVVERLGADVVCISTLPPQGLPQARYLCKRLRERFPRLRILVGMWSPHGSLERAETRLGSGPDLRVTTTFAGALQSLGQWPQASRPEAPIEGQGAASVQPVMAPVPGSV